MTENLKRNNKHFCLDYESIWRDYVPSNAAWINKILNLKKDAFIYVKPKYILPVRRSRGCNPLSWPDPDHEEFKKRIFYELHKKNLDFYIREYSKLVASKKTTNHES